MAHFLLDAITGNVIDAQGVLSVHSMINSESSENTKVIGSDGEQDTFQCGRCKKQFTSLFLFISHKKNCVRKSTVVGNGITAAAIAISSDGEKTIPSQTQIQIPTSYNTLPPGAILSETDLLSFTTSVESGNAVTTIPRTSPSSLAASLQHQGEASIVFAPCTFPQTTIAAIQEVVAATEAPLALTASDNSVSSKTESSGQAVSSVEPLEQAVITTIPQSVFYSQAQTSPQTINLSVLQDTLVSTPLLVTSTNQAQLEAAGAVASKVVVRTVKEAAVLHSVKERTEFVKQDSGGTVLATSEANAKIKSPGEGSSGNDTANIVTEFHSSMVKSKRRLSAETGDSSQKKASKMKCAYCGKEFNKNFDLQQHIRCHTGEKPFQCIVCGRSFAQKSNVKKHMQTHKVWPDGLAHTLPSQKNAADSKEETSPEKDSSEAEAFKEEDEAKESGNVISSKSYACPYCSFISDTYLELKSHMKEHKTVKVFRCIVSTCGQMFQDMDTFLDHMKSHEPEMSYYCHLCRKPFSSLNELGMHQVTHTLYPSQSTKSSSKTFRCNRCLNRYVSPEALEHHISTCNHNYPCPHCSKIFPCERYLRRHLPVHTTLTSFKCSFCQKGFKTKHYLKVHQVIHTGEKPYRCNICDASFNRGDKLKRHRLVHETVKRFKCPFRNHLGCLKEFNRADKLKAHILTHSGIKTKDSKKCRRTGSGDHCSTCFQVFTQQKQPESHVCLESKTVSSGRNNQKIRLKTKSKQGQKVRIFRHHKHSLMKKRTVSNKVDPFDSEDIPTAHIEIITVPDIDIIIENTLPGESSEKPSEAEGYVNTDDISVEVVECETS